jgi:hypothetical protein
VGAGTGEISAPVAPRSVAAPPSAPPRAGGRRRALLVAGGFVTAVVLPAVWLVGAWWMGPKLNHEGLPFLTPVLFVLVLLGLPASVLLAFRALFRAEARLAAAEGRQPLFRVRRTAQGIRAARPVIEPAPLPDLSPARRLGGAVLVVVMFVGTVGVWLGAPLWSIWAASQIAGSPRPAMWPYLLVIVGIAVTMAIGVRLLALVQRAYTRCMGTPEERRRSPAGWLRSYTDDRAVRGTERGLEAAMVAAVILAVILLFVWFFAFTDPHGLLPPGMDQM